MGKGPEKTRFKRRYRNEQQLHEKVLNITIIREMQIKIMKSYHHTVGRMAISKRQEITSVGEKKKKTKTSVGEDVEKRALLHFGRNVNLYSYYGKHYRGSLKIF